MIINLVKLRCSVNFKSTMNEIDSTVSLCLFSCFLLIFRELFISPHDLFICAFNIVVDDTVFCLSPVDFNLFVKCRLFYEYIFSPYTGYIKGNSGSYSRDYEAMGKIWNSDR